MTSGRKLTFALLTLWLASTLQTRSATVWDGPVISFAEMTTDPTQPVNQDRMTANVWITRGPLQGIFNAKTETQFTHFFSPADTQWANGNLTNYTSLPYTDWNTWAKITNGGPPSTVEVNAVVHLVSDDIYLGLKFKFWGVTGGLFSYERTTPHGTVLPILLTLTRAGSNVVLTWTNALFSLQSSTNVAGPYTTMAAATSPSTNSITGAQMYFRLIH